MKDTIRLSIIGLCVASAMAAAMYFPTKANSGSVSVSSEQISWTGFCKARGYDPETSDTAIIDEYLDTWVGSIEEERVFNNITALED